MIERMARMNQMIRMNQTLQTPGRFLRHPRLSRTRRCVVLCTLAIGWLAFGSSAAWAAGETVGGCVFNEAKKIEKGHGSFAGYKSLAELEKKSKNDEKAKSDLATFETDLERCLESPNPIFPAVDEIVWGGAAFLVLLTFMLWKGYPSVRRAMDMRSEKIRVDLDAADTAKAEAMRMRSEYEAQLVDAKVAAASVIDEARVQADALKKELQDRVQEELAEQKVRAAEDIQNTKRQAVNDLRSDVLAIAVGAAEKIVGVSLNAEAHRALVDRYIDEMALNGDVDSER